MPSDRPTSKWDHKDQTKKKNDISALQNLWIEEKLPESKCKVLYSALCTVVLNKRICNLPMEKYINPPTE